MQTIQQPTDWQHAERVARRRFHMAQAVSSPSHQPRHLDACECDIDPGGCEMHAAREHITRRMKERIWQRAYPALAQRPDTVYAPVINRRAAS